MAHLDAEVLAEFRAGLITGRRGASITAHLTGCDRCTALGDQLARVSALLASVPVPAMPDLVAQRLDTVLATEAAQKDQAERARADSPGHRATDGERTPRRPSSRRPSSRRPSSRRPSSRRPSSRRPSSRQLGFRLLSARVLAPVAVIVLAAGGYGLSRAIGPGGQATATAGSAAGRAMASAPAKAAPSIAASARGPVDTPLSPPVRGAQGTVPRPQQVTAANFSLVASSTDFSAATLKRQVEAELGRATPAEVAQPVSAQLRACVQNLTGGAVLVRVESARFAGQPATLVVARTGTDEMAWIAGPDCSATSRDVLATTSVP
jgi:hypothetical protein